MVGRMTAICGALAALLGACSPGDPGATDAGADAARPTCEVPPGHSFVISRMAILPAGQGFDLSGDGEIDNELGKLAVLEEETSEILQRSIEVGELLVIPHLTGWNGTRNDDELSAHFFVGADADIPPDPSNNLTGEGKFLITRTHLDLNCQSKVEDDSARIEEGSLHARQEEWSVALFGGLGTFRFARAIVEAEFIDEELTRMRGRVGAVVTICAASFAPFPRHSGGNMLSVLVNEFGDVVAPDIDIDGDGLEQVIGDGTGIAECIDGDGTVISGPECPCRLQDGYSIAFAIDLVPASIVGVF